MNEQRQAEKPKQSVGFERGGGNNSDVFICGLIINLLFHKYVLKTLIFVPSCNKIYSRTRYTKNTNSDFISAT